MSREELAKNKDDLYTKIDENTQIINKKIEEERDLHNNNINVNGEVKQYKTTAN